MQQRRAPSTSRDRPQTRPPARRSTPRRRSGVDRDRLYLGAMVAIIAVSVVAFALLIIAGADQFGDDDGGNQGDLLAAGTDPTAEAAPDAASATAPAGVIPTPDPNSTASPAAEATATPEPERAAGAARTGDRPLVCLDVGHGGVDLGNVRVET